MLKKILWATLVCILVFIAEGIFHPVTAAASDKDAASPKKYTILFYVQGLNDTDIDGSGLPNMKKLKSDGISYQHLAKTVPAHDQNALTGILGLQDDRLLLTRALADNGAQCLAIDGTGTITAALAIDSQLELISEKKDRLAVDKFLDKISGHPYQFAAIYLDDTSTPDKANQTSGFNRWSLADNQVGRVLNQLIQLDKLSHSTIIITGGGDKPPLIIFNSNNNQPGIFYHCRQQDIAPTICKMHGITPPVQMPGHILYESLAPTSGKSLTGNLKQRISDLQRECQQYNQQINLLQAERQSLQTQKAAIKKERENIHRIISEKDSIVHRLSLQIKILKLLGAVIFIILSIGYIVQYRWLRKKFLIFP